MLENDRLWHRPNDRGKVGSCVPVLIWLFLALCMRICDHLEDGEASFLGLKDAFQACVNYVYMTSYAYLHLFDQV